MKHNLELQPIRIQAGALKDETDDSADNPVDTVVFADQRIDSLCDRIQCVIEQVVHQLHLTRVMAVQVTCRHPGPLGDSCDRTAGDAALADNLDRSLPDTFDFGCVDLFGHCINE